MADGDDSRLVDAINDLINESSTWIGSFNPNIHNEGCLCEYLPISKSRGNLTGMVFGRLTVLGHLGTDELNHRYWHVICECGTEKFVKGKLLKNGHCKSCGCGEQEARGKSTTTHGRSSHPCFRVWANIVYRCTNPKHSQWMYYGGRGITVCKRWLDSVENFIEDMSGTYFDGCRIDRIDNNLLIDSYSMNNCRWVTPLESARNTRANRVFEYNGESMCLSAWAEKVGINHATLRNRYEAGWEIEDVLFDRIHRKGSYTPRPSPRILLNKAGD